jgi:rubrerythrin
MGVFFSGDELLKIAVQNEESGYAFYRGAEASAADQGLKDLFRYLAEQENVHKQKFLAMRDRLRASAQPDEPGDSDRIDPFIRAMTDSRLFDGSDKAIASAAGAADPKTAVDFAIAFEKDTLLFFYQLLDQVRSADRPMVQAVIEEEKDHIRRLAEVRKTLR